MLRKKQKCPAKAEHFFVSGYMVILRWFFVLHAEAVGIGEAVIDVETGGDDEIARNGGNRALHTFSQKTGTVLIAAAIASFSLISREKLGV